MGGEKKIMRYHNISKDDMLNGDGLRVVLWLSGCEHGCPGCQNPITWDPNSGLIFTGDTWEELEDLLDNDYISGLTLSGGDPLHTINRDEVLELCKMVKHCFPTKTIWLYTGYLWEEIEHLEILDYIDVLVDGPFKKELADITYHWAGSTNQRVIDVQESLKQDRIVEYGAKY